MRFTSLGSGSEGNALVVEAGKTRLMLDCGFGLAEVVRRLQKVALKPEELAGIVVTHEHEDHVGGVQRFARKYQLPVLLTHGTWVASGGEKWNGVNVKIIDSHLPWPVGDLQLLPFPVPHDAREPTQFVFTDGQRALGVLTDTGTSTPHIEAMLREVDALVLECNHDLSRLMASHYPNSLKQRISGRLGHLDNQAAADLLRSVIGERSRLQHVIAAHLSKQNNSASLAQQALARVLGCEEHWIGVASQDEGFDWREIH